MRRQIKLTELELHSALKEAVKSIILEYGEGKEEEIGRAVRRGLKQGKIGPYNAASREMNKGRWSKEKRDKFQKGLEEEETLEEYTDSEIKRMYGYRPDDYEDEDGFNEQPTNKIVEKNTNMKRPIRLTESDLHNIVRESVNKILTELDWKTYANAAKKSSELGQHERAAKFRDAAIDRFNSDYGYEDDVRSLKAMSAYDDDWNTWRPMRNGKTISPLDANTPHMSLHYNYDDGKGYEEYAKTSTDLENDGERSIHGDYDAYSSNGFGMSSAPIGHFPIGGFEEKDGKWIGRNDRGFGEFDDYRKGKYDYNSDKGWYKK